MAVRGYQSDYRRHAPQSADAFDEYMNTLPLEQQYGLVRLCMCYAIYPDSPAWLIFAASRTASTEAQRHIEKATRDLDSRLLTLVTDTNNARTIAETIRTRLDPLALSMQRASSAADRLIAEAPIIHYAALYAWALLLAVGVALAGGGWAGWTLAARDANDTCRVAVIREKTRMLDNMRQSTNEHSIRRFLDARKSSL